MKKIWKYQERIKFLEKVKSMLNYGYLLEMKLIRETGLPAEEEDEMIDKRKETLDKALEEINEEIGKLVDKYYESDEMEALQKEAEVKGAEIWNNER